MKQEEQLVALYRSGASLRQTADAVGISVHSARKKLIERLGAVRPAGRKGMPRERIDFVVKLYLSGKSIGETGKVVGVTPQRVSQILAKEGIPTRGRRRA